MAEKKDRVSMGRFTVVLPLAILEDLGKWAEEEGRPRADLTSYLLELAVRRKYPDKYPPKQGEYPENDSAKP